jgi:hypothetical protein
MTPHELQRRTLLRGLLVTGCALCLPAMSGCEGKKPPGTATQPDANANSGGGQPGESSGGKLAQAKVKYQDQPKGEQSCANCLNFLPESSTCRVVAGQVSPQGWCVIWTRKLA